jgi:succinoglycan biosynthesis protein ExoO
MLPRRIAVIVTDRQIMPPIRGNRVRILATIRALRALGWRIVVITCQGGRGNGLELEVDRIHPIAASPFPGGDVARFDVRPFRAAVDAVVAAVAPALLIAEYAWLAPALAGVSGGITRLVDCHDVLHERTSRFTAAGLDPWIRCSSAQERALLRAADVVVAIQHREREVLQALLPDRRVVCLLPAFHAPPEVAADSGETETVLAVGSSHAGNFGIRRFAEEAWPAVLRSHPAARLRIAGSIGNEVPALPGVERLGEVPDLAREYRRAAVVVCPIEVGTGAKIKMLEALRHGKAVVATPSAAEGLPTASAPAWRTVPSAAGGARAVEELLADGGARRELARRARDYGEEHLSLPRFQADLSAILAPPRWLAIGRRALGGRPRW